jgi:DNA modification methylase
MKVAKELGRNSYGYEVDLELKDVVLEKIEYGQATLTGDTIEYKVREDAKRLRTFLQERVKSQKSVTNNRKAL